MNENLDLDNQFPYLSKEQKALLLLLIESGVTGNALIGTMLLLKDDQKLMDEMILFIWENKPSPEEINDLLIEMAQEKFSYQESEEET